MILIAESPSRRTEYRRYLGNAGLSGRIGLFGRAIRPARSTTRGSEAEIAWKAAFGCFSLTGGKPNGECRMKFFRIIFFYGLYFILCMIVVTAALQEWSAGAQMLFARNGRPALRCCSPSACPSCWCGGRKKEGHEKQQPKLWPKQATSRRLPQGLGMVAGFHQAKLQAWPGEISAGWSMSGHRLC